MSIPADLPKNVFTTAPRAFTPQFLQDTRIEVIGSNGFSTTAFTTVTRSISGFPVGVDKHIALDINACIQLPNGAPPPIFLTSFGYGSDWQIVSLQLSFLQQSKPIVTFNVYVEGNDQASAGGELQYMFGGWTPGGPPLATGYGTIPLAQAGLVWRSMGPSITDIPGTQGSSFPPMSDYDVLFQYGSTYDAAAPELVTGVTYPSIRQSRRFTFDCDTVNFTAVVATTGNGAVASAFPVGFGLAGMIL